MPEYTPHVALIQFPGSNCEWETKRAAEAAGIPCDVFRWNRDPALLDDYDGYIIGGGFSYQDRIRSGVIAVKEPIIKRVFDEVTEKGKPCIGICNGAQVLVEAGLIPGINAGKVEMALAPNFRDPEGRIAGFCCRWVYLKHACKSGRSQFTSAMPENYVWPVPIAHGEGRYTTRIADLLDTLHANDQIVFQYCDADGNVDPARSVNPNGALENIAALCNPEGNVMAIMPHPERASFLRQIPGELDRAWGNTKIAAWGDLSAMNGAGPGRLVFESMKAALAAVPA
jgi:phosphoribosylformylglycinamidine synthase